MFDVYEERLRRWRQRCEALRRQAGEPPSPGSVQDPDETSTD